MTRLSYRQENWYDDTLPRALVEAHDIESRVEGKEKSGLGQRLVS